MKKEIYLIVDNIRSLYNVGSMFRTSDAFKINRIYLCGYTGTPPRKEISKTALGAENEIPWESHPDTLELVKELKRKKVKIATLELSKKAKDLNKIKPQFPLALVVGNEIQGVDSKVIKQADYEIKIPMQGIKESLNVAVATGIALYQLSILN